VIHLNLPILDKLDACQHILVAGMGGGFDVFCGLPIYFELQGLGKQVHLANFSFSFLGDQHDALNLSGTLVGITADTGVGTNISLNSIWPSDSAKSSTRK
jgi:hypothetical protein